MNWPNKFDDCRLNRFRSIKRNKDRHTHGYIQFFKIKISNFDKHKNPKVLVNYYNNQYFLMLHIISPRNVKVLIKPKTSSSYKQNTTRKTIDKNGFDSVNKQDIVVQIFYQTDYVISVFHRDDCKCILDTCK